MSIKFTPGTWEIEVGCSQVFVTTENKFIHEGNVDTISGNREERIANAYLIKTSPKMYAMLEFLVNNDSINDSSIDNEVLALLAEARGE